MFNRDISCPQYVYSIFEYVSLFNVDNRSVEKLYVPDRTGHLLRHFVPKFQRRSPLINRGYWLRMELVKQTVEEFLSSNTGVTKHLVNLGCGFDPLPLHYLRQYPGVDFIDVDYPQSIRRKAEILQNTPELNGLLIDPQYSLDLDTTVISSANYTAIGTDLRDLCKFDEILRARCQASDEILFISEVAITYMPVEDADSLIKWAAQFPGAKFALIEQILPASEKHPFAKTMLSHFRKIQSALQNIGKYPSLTSQVKRFYTYGWGSVVACDFYGAWCNLVSTEQKSFVESVEPFDEWEDFVSFGQHYFFLYASSRVPDGKHMSLSTREWLGGSRITTQEIVKPDVKSLQNSQVPTLTASLEYRKYWQPGFDRRKFGAAAKLSDGVAIYYGGMDTKSRSSTAYIFDETHMKVSRIDSNPQPAPRMCHTLTHVGNRRVLLVGGRGNPKSALADCWLFNGSVWARVQDLPNGRYRHSATHISIKGEDRVLVFGGRGNGNEIYNTWVIWSESSGWSEVTSIRAPPISRFSASLSWFPTIATGVLTGGFSRDGNIISDILFWSFNSSGSIEHQQWRPLSEFESSFLCRAGAQLIPIGSTKALLVGGMLGHCVPTDFPGTFLCLDISNQTIEPLYTILPGKEQDMRPVLMGCAYVWLNNRLHIFGGGITAFSMGSFWSLCTGILEVDQLRPVELSSRPKKPQLQPAPSQSINLADMYSELDSPKPTPVEIYTLARNPIEIQSAICRRVPLLFDNLSFGECIRVWSPEYLKAAFGESREVIVHRVTSSDQNQLLHLNFNSKNFKYQQMNLSTFIDLAFADKPTTLCYLRSISQKPTKHPSLFHRDFPEISTDFHIPDELLFIKDSLHSSPLRISSPGVGIWLHYDVCANFLFHIKGEKRLLLFPPDDIGLLQFPAGKTTSSILNIFEGIPNGTHPLEITMHPGDTLFIPPFWLHAVLPLSPCIAINTFFHWFDDNLHSAGKDLYGNKDLACYEEGRGVLKDLVGKFDGLDENTRRFYIMRLGQELLGIGAEINRGL
ncbi:tRNA methyltransferase ppm2 [Orbilia oligospora]|uniref:tRNA wybutosine-synthesizing protein 4 n=1 Tax=Orbilia oligospora TaxID=2813651 RepID=A0A8H8V087_ORBOL|nr:tRNA methyltransferase ppm2 [Orbilia oligospora]